MNVSVLSAQTILQAALLVDPSGEDTDYILTDPESMVYDVAVETPSNQLGRQISHNRLTFDDLAARHRDHGLPD